MLVFLDEATFLRETLARILKKALKEFGAAQRWISQVKSPII